MKYHFFLLAKENYDELDKLASRVSLDEKIDKECFFIVGIKENDLQGAVGFSFRKNKPRLEHIIVDKPYQRTRFGVLLLKEMEKLFIDRGYKEYYSYILDTNNKMINYAIKWGMKLREVGNGSSWYYKALGSV